jgi:hypothetical protein
MTMARRFGALCGAGLAVMALSACGNPATDVANTWIPIARTSEGGQVEYLPSSIRRGEADGTTDIAVKVTYPNWQMWTVDDPDTTGSITFVAERVQLRFDCPAKTFAIVQREALDKQGYVKHTINPPVPAKAAFAPVAPDGLASVAIARACPAPAP